MHEADSIALEGIRLKLRRAYEQLKALELEISRYIDRKGYTIEAETNTESTERIGRLKVIEPLPVLWAVILGEAIHNLRSALDHTIYQLIIDATGNEPVTKSAFPIFDDSGKFAKSGASQILGVGPGVETFIKGLQPYACGNPDYHPLLSLYELWNQDKHRVIARFALLLTEPKIEVRHAIGPYVLDTSGIDHGGVQNGAEVYVLSFDRPNPQVQVNVEFAVYVSFNDPGSSPDGGLYPLWQLYDYAAGVVSILLGLIGRQDEPVVGQQPLDGPT